MAFDRAGSEHAQEDRLKTLAKPKDVLVQVGMGNPLCTTTVKLSCWRAATFEVAQFSRRILQLPVTLLFQPCLPGHHWSIKQLVSEVFLSKTLGVRLHLCNSQYPPNCKQRALEVNYTYLLNARLLLLNRQKIPKLLCLIPAIFALHSAWPTKLQHLLLSLYTTIIF